MEADLNAKTEQILTVKHTIMLEALIYMKEMVRNRFSLSFLEIHQNLSIPPFVVSTSSNISLIAPAPYYSRWNETSGKQGTQTVEIIDEDLDKVVGNAQTSVNASNFGLVSNLNSRSKSKGYIDTIVKYNDDGADLKISNIVRIGDRYITKEWECGEEWQRKYGTRNVQGELHSPLRSLYDTATGHVHSPERSQRSQRRETQSVEPIPTFRGTQQDQMELTTYHEACEL